MTTETKFTEASLSETRHPETALAEHVSQGRAFYHSQVFRRQMILVALVLALFFSLCVDLALGPARYSLGEVIAALFTPDSVSQQARVILWEIRMPVALMALVVGASLSVAGAQMQTILSNPLACLLYTSDAADE